MMKKFADPIKEIIGGDKNTESVKDEEIKF